MSDSATVRRFRAVAILIAALPVGGFAVHATRSYIADQLAAARPAPPPPPVPVETVALLVAKRDLERGAQIGTDTVAVRDVPRQFAGAAAIPAERFDAIAGARVDVAVRGGDAITDHMIARAEPAHFAGRLRDGMRALTIAVDEVNAMSGLLQPGDRIDVQYSLRPPVGRDGLPPAEVTAPLLQDVLVLATGRRARPGADEGAARSHSTITVQVDPAQAQRLIVAQRGGRITAILRNGEDRAQVKPVAMDVYSLIGTAPQAARRQGPEIIVGGRGALLPTESQALRAAPGASHAEAR